MKATLQFDLPEEQPEFYHATHGVDYSVALDEIDNLLRAHLKYEVHTHWDSQTVEEIREALGEICAGFEDY